MKDRFAVIHEEGIDLVRNLPSINTNLVKRKPLQEAPWKGSAWYGHHNDQAQEKQLFCRQPTSCRIFTAVFIARQNFNLGLEASGCLTEYLTLFLVGHLEHYIKVT